MTKMKIEPYRRLDHVVVKSHDEAVGEVELELLGELLDHAVKPLNHEMQHSIFLFLTKTILLFWTSGHTK